MFVSLSLYIYIYIYMYTLGTLKSYVLHRVQTDSVVHSTSYPMGTGCLFPDIKAAGA
jgi:hypothetical protein